VRPQSDGLREQSARNLPSEWDIIGSGDPSLQGFTTDISVDQSQTIRFKINTPTSAYRIDICQMGHCGARLSPTIRPNGPPYWVDVVFVTSLGPDTTPPDYHVDDAAAASDRRRLRIERHHEVQRSDHSVDHRCDGRSNCVIRQALSFRLPSRTTYSREARSAIRLPLSRTRRSTPPASGEARPIDESRIYRGTRSPHVHAVVHDQATTAAADRWSWRSNPRRELDQQSVQPRRREILRAEGMNEFAAVDLSTVTATTLNPYDVVILGEVPLTQCTATIKAGVKDLRVTRCRPTSYGVW
jgi:hypothetical protein